MILVTGSNGQLGKELRLILNSNDAIFGDKSNCDITNIAQIEEIINENNLKYIINCAAYTAVDKAESESDEAFLINQQGPKNLAKLAVKYQIKLVHISTDYVFDGQLNRPFTEEDQTSPLNIYGKSKLAGEIEILKSECQGIIIRTSWLYSQFGNNFVKSMIRLGQSREKLNIVADQVGSPTNAKDLAQAIVKIIPQLNNSLELEDKNCKIYHYSNEGVASWYDFACSIFEYKKINCSVSPIETSEYPLAAERPLYSVLNKKCIRTRFGLTISHWRESLQDCLNSL